MRFLRLKWVLRAVAAFVLLPVLTAVAGGFEGSRAYAALRDRRAQLRERAERAGLDPLLVLDPSGYDRAKRLEDKARREAAVAALPRFTTPSWFLEEAAAIQKQQALRTLAGVGRDRKEGLPVATRDLEPISASLFSKVKSARVRLKKAVPAELRTIERMAKPVLGIDPTAPLLRARGRPLFGAWSPSREAIWRVLRPLLPPVPSFLQAALPSPGAPDLAPTPDAQSTHPLIVSTASALGNDPARIFWFVRNTIRTELYRGSLKGALGTLREGGGNHTDQASLLIALLRAAGIPTRYEFGSLILTVEQAMAYTGAETLSAAADALNTNIDEVGAIVGQGEERGMGVRIGHVWVRAYVPTTAYRGIPRPGTHSDWVHLAPAIKSIDVDNTVDLRLS